MNTMLSTGICSGGLMDALLLLGWMRMFCATSELQNFTFPMTLTVLIGKWFSTDCAHWIPQIASKLNQDIEHIIDDQKVLMNSEIAGHITCLWDDSVFRDIYEDRSEYQLYNISDSAAYFFSEIDRIGNHQYMPSDQDIVFLSSPQSKIVDFKFSMYIF